MENTNIRKALLKDVQFISQIAVENTSADLNTHQMKQRGFLVSNYSFAQYEDYVEKCEHFYVLEKNDTIQGFLLVFQDDELDYNQVVNHNMKKHAQSDFVVIKQICVAKNAHKQGFGRKLYEHLMSTVKKDIFLSVVFEPYNEGSVHFHNRLGFKQIFTIVAEDQMKRGVFFWKH